MQWTGPMSDRSQGVPVASQVGIDILNSRRDLAVPVGFTSHYLTPVGGFSETYLGREWDRLLFR
jgi:hypothetical protein